MVHQVWEFCIGPGGYTTQTLAFVLKDTPVANNTSRLATRLGVKYLELVLLHLSSWYYDCSKGDKINSILEIWSVRYPTQALLGVLFYHLMEIDCEDAVEVLEQAIINMPRVRSRHVSVSTDEVCEQNDSDIERVAHFQSANKNGEEILKTQDHNKTSLHEGDVLLLHSEDSKLTAKFSENECALNSTCASEKSIIMGTHRDEHKLLTKNAFKRLSEGNLIATELSQNLVGTISDCKFTSNDVFQIYPNTPRFASDNINYGTNLSYGIKPGQKRKGVKKFAEKHIGKTQQDSMLSTCSYIIYFGWIILFGLTCFALIHIYASERIFPFKIEDHQSSFTKYETLDTSSVYPEPSPTVYTKTKQVLHVRSYIDFRKTLAALPYNQAISLVLHMDNPASWPDEKKIESIHRITDLKIVDSFSAEVILNVLQTMPNLKTLTIVNANYFVCRTEISSELVFERVSLPNLEQLSFENLNECSGLYKTIASSLAFENLQILSFKNVVIGHKNVASIQDLLCNARKTLRGIEFIKSIWHVDVLEGMIGSFLKIESIEIDFLDDSNPGIKYIGENFHRMFPKLKTFKSKLGTTSWDMFIVLTKSKKLEYIELGLRVPKSHNKVDLVQLADSFPSLKELKIFIDFEAMGNTSVCRVEGFDKASQKLRKFDCETNCASLADITQMEKFPTEFKNGGKRGTFKSC